MQKTLQILACCCLAAMLTACSAFIYKPDLQQGNIFTQEQIDKLRVGMTKAQVLYVLGSPVLENIYAQNRWDYVYSFQSHGGSIHIRRLSLQFHEDTLRNIENALPISYAH